MSKFDFSKEIAAGMEKVLNSDENKQLFSQSSMLEKLAFKRVADEDKPTEIEVEVQKTMDDSLNKEAQLTGHTDKCTKCAGKYFMDKHPNAACNCACASPEECANGCTCHSSPAIMEPNAMLPAPSPEPSGWGKASSVTDVVQNLLKVSDALDTLGFDKLAAATILLTDKLIVEAKAKKDSKSAKKDSKKDEKSSKSKSKMSQKDRMKKLRDAKKKKSSKSSK